MRILAIETSCDDTCASILKIKKQKTKNNFEILSNVVSSQEGLHRKYGGVYPTLAKREHQRNLTPVLIQALKQSKLLKTQNQKPKTRNKSQIINQKFHTLKEILTREETLYKKLKQFFEKYQKPAIDAIAVTKGPGLEPCLWVGVNFAKALGFWWNLPIISVNHLEAHIFAGFVENESEKKPNSSQPKTTIIKDGFGVASPAICLVASGGHTQLILMKDIGKYKLIGETLDDAAGECLDKTARLLGLSYPGGPAIAAEAAMELKTQNPKMKVSLPRPMLNSKDYNFSFSGLKTAVLYDYKKRPKKIRERKEYIRAMTKEIQQAIIDILTKKTLRAVRDFHAKTIILGGGVAANEELRKQFSLQLTTHNLQLNFFAPQKKFCTDNAAMVGIAGYFQRKNASRDWRKIKAEANLKIREANF